MADDPDSSILGWAEPLVAPARDRLRQRIACLPGGSELPDRHPLLTPDRPRLLGMVNRVALLELDTAQPADPAAGRRLLAQYPVLHQELHQHAEQWANVRAELAERVVADSLELPGGLADIASIAFGAGDSHRGGRSVAILTFRTGGKVVYKPRSLAVERHFNDLVRHLRLSHSLRTARVIDRGTHGWCEYIESLPCKNSQAVQRFYWRQGAYLALFHALRAYDMHAWNLIAHGEHPVYIDLEAMFRPEHERGFAGMAPGSAPAKLREAVLTTHVLPRWVAEGNNWRDTGGLAGGRPAGGPAPGPNPTTNRPHLAGSEPPVDVAAIVAGFQECYRYLLAARDELLAADGLITAFAGDEVRVVLRNTRFYVGLTAKSWQPDLLRGGADREKFLDVLDSGLADVPQRDLVAASERAQLRAHDVPVLHTRPRSTALEDPQGVVAADFFPQSGLSAVEHRLTRFSEADLAEQSWFVRASLATLDNVSPGHVPPAGRPAPVPSQTVDQDLLVDAAKRIGEELVGTALRDPRDRTVDWLSLHPAGDRWELGATPLGLSAGVCGVALFLAELGAVTSVAKYRELAEDVVAGLLDPANSPDPEQLRLMSVGCHEGLGAVVLLLVRLSKLWADPGLPENARLLTGRLCENLATTEDLSFATGVAGAAVVLAEVHRELGSPEAAAGLRLATDRLTQVTAPPAEFETADDDSLARGNTGRVELLLATGSDQEAATAHGIAEQVARRVLTGRIRTGAPTGVWTPGLFFGAAGIGHGLIRTATPAQVRSVLPFLAR